MQTLCLTLMFFWGDQEKGVIRKKVKEWQFANPDMGRKSGKRLVIFLNAEITLLPFISASAMLLEMPRSFFSGICLFRFQTYFIIFI